MRLHIGRKAPKGYKEIGKSMHLGCGIWVMQIAIDHDAPIGIKKGRTRPAKAVRRDRGASDGP